MSSLHRISPSVVFWTLCRLLDNLDNTFVSTARELVLTAWQVGSVEVQLSTTLCIAFCLWSHLNGG